MKKILLTLTIGCIISWSVAFAQTSASVLSPGAPAPKVSMTDASSDPTLQTQTQTQTPPPAQVDQKAKTTKKDKKDKKAKEDDANNQTCTKDGCTHHHTKDQPCCKKADKADKKPTFMQDPNTTKKE